MLLFNVISLRGFCLLLLALPMGLYAQGDAARGSEAPGEQQGLSESSAVITRREAADLAREHQPGRVLNVRFDEPGAFWLVRIEHEGTLFNVRIDALSGEFIAEESGE